MTTRENYDNQRESSQGNAYLTSTCTDGLESERDRQDYSTPDRFQGAVLRRQDAVLRRGGIVSPNVVRIISCTKNLATSSTVDD
jgi:hypothetical protein